ncbi:protein NEOXANTHIN-DEFICIENT 1 isoform X4 [Populus trichocarpa]|uniref:protein NEOXANTHIN-DEFICIENT 1 isoform X4 n=1 Tax=Populus trichocarpa TaxID=3694 RepID=UPI000D188385|nr:protein NEOXANTHIN-DEFICIENT 1 isoform X4 [Populus trichocarpa]|eukprot:XP_024448859.1 protein NEOXANTHIN-DEFICIENT 1 isoform X4 [Populus trichocarpa]
MAAAQTKCSLGYGKPPWIFKGRALYQLHLVKSKIARASIPKEFRLVEAFGYTLGGFFLASYEDSPAGVFDELVVIAGIVWNPPTSCAWAARVLVNSGDACDHGRKDVGLPSQVAKFSKKITAIPRRRKSKFNGFLDMIGLGTASSSTKDCMDVLVTETNGPSATDICNIKLTTSVPGVKFDKWKGPAIKMSLPSFSGRTEYNPNLLKYTCSIECRYTFLLLQLFNFLDLFWREHRKYLSRSLSKYEQCRQQKCQGHLHHQSTTLKSHRASLN